MNPSHPTPDRDAEEQASLWTARLEGSSLSSADRAALNAWLEEDPGRSALLASYRQLSADLGSLLPGLAASGRVELPPTAAPRRERTGFPRWAAAGFLAAAAVAAVWLGTAHGRSEKIATAVGERRSFTLADGTRVELNANTSMVVDNGAAERRVHLADGEAYFEVSKNKARPFIVETPAGSVRVTGTRFDVRTEAASVLDVTVVEGSVQVRAGSAAAEPVLLGPGDLLSAGAHGVSLRALSAGALQDALAWREGQVVFDGVPLSEGLARVAHYFGRKITVSDRAAVLRINVRMNLDNLDEFFTSFETAFPKLRVTRDAEGGARVSLRTED